jgi:mono/diheme cytochrome c family protein
MLPRSRRGLAAAAAVLLLLAASPLPAMAAGEARRGEPLYQRYCTGCHGVDGRGGAKNFMPHVGALTRKDYIEHLGDDYLTFVINEGGEAAGKSSYMPAWKSVLSEQDVADVVAYVRSLSLQ